MGWTSAVGWFLHAKMRGRARRLRDDDRWRKYTARIQASTLRTLLSHAADTKIGREAGFAEIASIPDPSEVIAAYRKAVPVGDWYTIKDRVARMREGAEPDVLWPGAGEAVAQTSGTTAGDKFIPVTDGDVRSNYRVEPGHLRVPDAGASRWGGDHVRAVPVPGRVERSEEGRNGIITADLSGLVTPLIRWPLSAIYSPGPEIALMNDWPSKIEAMAGSRKDQDIRFISGMPSGARC
jgi:hypothetical protein